MFFSYYSQWANWRAYNKINRSGFNHYKVNHKENFVNPETGKHTQLVECLWGVNKRQIPNRIRGKSTKLLQTYLAQQWFKSIHGSQGPVLFLKILHVLKVKSLKTVQEEIKAIKTN